MKSEVISSLSFELDLLFPEQERRNTENTPTSNNFVINLFSSFLNLISSVQRNNQQALRRRIKSFFALATAYFNHKVCTQQTLD